MFIWSGLSLGVSDGKLREEIWSGFVGQQNVFLATVEGDQPRLRPVSLLRFGDKLFVATGTGSAKAKQVKQNPKIEFCLLMEKDGKYGTIRAECVAKLVTDMKTKAEVYNNVAFMKEFWTSPNDARFALIALQPASYEYMPMGSMQATKVKA
jgi:uncharacterized pyridoxamine 5'-phosphate oxidase family protein